VKDELPFRHLVMPAFQPGLFSSEDEAGPRAPQASTIALDTLNASRVGNHPKMASNPIRTWDSPGSGGTK